MMREDGNTLLLGGIDDMEEELEEHEISFSFGSGKVKNFLVELILEHTEIPIDCPSET